MVLSAAFDGWMGLVVLLNCLCLAIEFQIDPSEDSLRAFRWLDFIFFLIYSIELYFRMKVLGLRPILTTPLLLLDFMIVFWALVAEIIIPISTKSFFLFGNTELEHEMSFVNTMKVFAMLKAVRILRLLSMFRNLWYVVQMFFFALDPLFSTLTFIMVVHYIFAIFSVGLLGTLETPGHLLKK